MDNAHWSRLGERGGVLGMRVLFAVYRLVGRWAFNLLLFPVIGYFYATSGNARRASQDYLHRVRIRREQLGYPIEDQVNTFNHLLQFGNAVLDKGAMWAGAFPTKSVVYNDPNMFEQVRAHGRGSVLIGSHLGNLEVLRAFAETVQGLSVNALVFTRHSPKFNRVLSAVSPRALDHMIQVDSLGPDSVMRLQDRILDGQHVAIVGDRVSTRHEERSICVPFLGCPARFPEGPFILASLLDCPVYLLFCLKMGKTYRIFLEQFADPLELPRRNRRVALEHAISRYAERLEAHCLIAPTQWFNFFDFWGEAESKGTS